MAGSVGQEFFAQGLALGRRALRLHAEDQFATGGDPRGALAKAQEAADRSIALDPGLGWFYNRRAEIQGLSGWIALLSGEEQGLYGGRLLARHAALVYSSVMGDDCWAFTGAQGQPGKAACCARASTSRPRRSPASTLRVTASLHCKS